MASWHEITWNMLTVERRLEILISPNGWSTRKGTPSPTARRLSKTVWAAIPPLTQKTICQLYVDMQSPKGR